MKKPPRLQARGVHLLFNLVVSVTLRSPLVVGDCGNGTILAVGGFTNSMLRFALESTFLSYSLSELAQTVLLSPWGGGKDARGAKRKVTNVGKDGGSQRNILVLSVVFSSPWMLEAQILGFRKHVR